MSRDKRGIYGFANPEFRATHHALDVPELRYQILTELSVELESIRSSDPHDGHMKRRTLLSLATSCKLLSSTALNVLWLSMGTIDPLLSIIGVHKKAVHGNNVFGTHNSNYVGDF
jgi:hypothetical protein